MVKKYNRFIVNSQEEISKRTLPDLLIPNLDIVIIGINPGLHSAFKGHHYAGPSNHFWKCLNLSGLTPEPMDADDDYKLLQFGIGFTNVVERTTKSSSDLNREEIKEGCKRLLKKLQIFRPKIAVFNGKIIYELFCGKKNFNFGVQPEFVEGTSTYIWVMPSSSARSAHLPSPADKLPFYIALKKFHDYLHGSFIEGDKEVFTFPRISKIIVDTNVNTFEKEVTSKYFENRTNKELKVGNDICQSKGKSSFEQINQERIESNLKVLHAICERRE